MIAVVVLYCVQLLSEKTFCLSLIMTHQQKYIGCLIKTQSKKHNIQTIFQEGSPWATLIHKSMSVVGVRYCVQLLPEVKTVQAVLLPFPLLKTLFFYLASFC